MTAWIGLKPAQESGVVVITDTVGSFADRETGRASYGRDDRKTKWLYGYRILNVISGPINDDELASAGIVDACSRNHSLANNARPPSDSREQIRESYCGIQRISDGIKQHHIAAGRPIENPNRADGDRSPHVLFAGGPEGEEPFLVKVTPFAETWAKPGDVIYSGCWREGITQDIAEEMRRAPDTLAGCRTVAAGWIRKVLLREFGTLELQETIASGWVPTVGFPLIVWTITADEIQREVINE